MKVKFIIMLTVAIGIMTVVESFSAHSSTHHFFKHRTKPREIRGFKPDSIHTAIGFGKREQGFEFSKLNRRERILMSSLLRNFPCGIPSDWLLRGMKINSPLARKFEQLTTDSDDDEQAPSIAQQKLNNLII